MDYSPFLVVSRAMDARRYPSVKSLTFAVVVSAAHRNGKKNIIVSSLFVVSNLICDDVRNEACKKPSHN